MSVLQKFGAFIFFGFGALILAGDLYIAATMPSKAVDAQEAVNAPERQPQVSVASRAGVIADPLWIPEQGDPAERERAMAVTYQQLDQQDDVYVVRAYCPCVECCGRWSADHPSRQGTGYTQRTASGTIPEEGRTAGSDWAVLSPGTVIEIDGVGRRVIEDRGSGISGNAIDLYMADHDACLRWGRQELAVRVVD